MLTPMYIPLETKAPLKGIFAWKIYQNDYSNAENVHNTFKLFVMWNRYVYVVVYSKHDIVVSVIHKCINLY